MVSNVSMPHFETVVRSCCHSEIVSDYEKLSNCARERFLAAFTNSCKDRYRLYVKAGAKQVAGDEEDCCLRLAFEEELRGAFLPVDVGAVALVREEHLPDWGRRRSRPEVEARHAVAIRHVHNLRSESDIARPSRTDSTSQKPTARLASFSWERLSPSSFRELIIFDVAHGKKLDCKIVMEPVTQHGVLVLAEDCNGDVMQIGLYNQFPGGASGCEAESMANETFPIGARLSIAEPFLKVMNDGWQGIRVDTPADVRVELSNIPSMSSLKHMANKEVAVGMFDRGRCSYWRALELPEVDDLAAVLADRAQAFLSMSWNHTVSSARDSAAVLILRPSHTNAWMRYAAALEKLSVCCPVEQARPSFKRLAQRARSVCADRNNCADNVVSCEDVRYVLRMLLSAFPNELVEFPHIVTETPEACSSLTWTALKQQGNDSYRAGDYQHAVGRYSAALHKIDCCNDVAAILSNLSYVSLELHQSHNAIAFACAASRFSASSLSAKLFFRLGRALNQLREHELLMELCDHDAGPAFVAQVQQLRRCTGFVPIKTRQYTSADVGSSFAAEVFLEREELFPDDVQQFNRGVQVGVLDGKGRGVIAIKDFQPCEIVVLSRALGAAVVEDECMSLEFKGNKMSDGSHCKVVSMLQNSASFDNELSWCLSQLADGPTSRRPLIQMAELSGLSPRWLPLLGQDQRYYPTGEQFYLSAPTIAEIVDINMHGFKELNATALFPEASLFNHDRTPNCAYVPLKCLNGSKVMRVLAVMTARPIVKGEELTVRYTESMEENNKWGICQTLDGMD